VYFIHSIARCRTRQMMTPVGIRLKCDSVELTEWRKTLNGELDQPTRNIIIASVV
jgi:hypothetical protein